MEAKVRSGCVAGLWRASLGVESGVQASRSSVGEEMQTRNEGRDEWAMRFWAAGGLVAGCRLLLLVDFAGSSRR